MRVEKDANIIMSDLIERNEELQAEVERLKALESERAAEHSRNVDLFEKRLYYFTTIIDKLQSRIAKLRAALEKVTTMESIKAGAFSHLDPDFNYVFVQAVWAKAALAEDDKAAE